MLRTSWSCSLAGALVAASVSVGCRSSERPPPLSSRPVSEVVVSLLGAKLAPTPLPNDVRTRRERDLRQAQEALARDPNDADALLWLGRRTAYLGRYNEAIGIFGEGIVRHPDDARFYRHRGHRYITVRRFDDAIVDLTMAASLVRGEPDAVEPDGLPNASNVPTTTLHGNIAYHLGLAHYLKGNFASALQNFEWSAETSHHPDHVVASTYWRYLTLRRIGRHGDATALLAPVVRDTPLLENQAYHRMLLFFREQAPLVESSGGRTSLDEATIGYGLGIWHLLEGHREEAESAFRRTIALPTWAAFGAIAAEAELARLEGRNL